jgi:hypothetical protein
MSSDPATPLLDEAREHIQSAIEKLSEVMSRDLIADWTPSFRVTVADTLRKLMALREDMR